MEVVKEADFNPSFVKMSEIDPKMWFEELWRSARNEVTVEMKKEKLSKAEINLTPLQLWLIKKTYLYFGILFGFLVISMGVATVGFRMGLINLLMLELIRLTVLLSFVLGMCLWIHTDIKYDKMCDQSFRNEMLVKKVVQILEDNNVDQSNLSKGLKLSVHYKTNRKNVYLLIWAIVMGTVSFLGLDTSAWIQIYSSPFAQFVFLFTVGVVTSFEITPNYFELQSLKNFKVHWDLRQ